MSKWIWFLERQDFRIEHLVSAFPHFPSSTIAQNACRALQPRIFPGLPFACTGCHVSQPLSQQHTHLHTHSHQELSRASSLLTDLWMVPEPLPCAPAMSTPCMTVAGWHPSASRPLHHATEIFAKVAYFDFKSLNDKDECSDYICSISKIILIFIFINASC